MVISELVSSLYFANDRRRCSMAERIVLRDLRSSVVQGLERDHVT